MVRDHYNQSALARELGVSRQMLSNIVLDQKEVSLPLSLKIESLFSLPEGTILRIQNDYKIHQYKELIRKDLFKKLMQAHAFWSYSEVTVETLPDELLIEKNRQGTIWLHFAVRPKENRRKIDFLKA